MNTFGRALLTLFLCLFLVGFGICGAYGVFGGVATVSGGRAEESLVFFVPAAIGLGIAWGCWKVIAGVWRKPPPGP